MTLLLGLDRSLIVDEDIVALYRRQLAEAERRVQKCEEKLRKANEQIGALKWEVEHLRKKRAR